MRLNSTLTLACLVALASPVRAQTPPSSELPRGGPRRSSRPQPGTLPFSRHQPGIPRLRVSTHLPFIR
jgi:hypothetical protein